MKSFIGTSVLIILLQGSQTLFAQKHVNIATDISSIIENYYTDIEDLNKVYIFKDSPEYFDRFDIYYRKAQQDLSAISFTSLSTNSQVDFILLKRNIVKAQKDLSEARSIYHQIHQYVSFDSGIISIQSSRRRGSYPDAMVVAAKFNGIKNQIDTLQIWFKKQQPLIASLNSKLSDVLENLRKGVQSIYSFYDAYDPMFTWWVKKPYTQLDSALLQYTFQVKSAITKQSAASGDGSGIEGNPIGAKALQDLLDYEMIPYTASELVEIANREFAWCDVEIKKASQQMGFGNDWKQALAKVKLNYVAPGRQPELVNTLAEEAIAFIEQHNMLTIPPLAKEVWRMSMLTEAQQRLAPFFLGGESILIGYPTDKMDFETRMMSMRSNNYAFSHATVYHELIPGHNLQYFMNRRYKQYRSAFRTPFSIEGWSLYWEMLLWDKNFNDTPEKKMGALFWRMHRCARIIFSLNYHLGKWTPQQCINFLMERVGHEKFSAEGEVRRSFTGNYGPLYQIAYMLGGLQLRQLYKEVVDNKKMTEKEFHDAYLQENAIPIEMFRAIITKQPLTENYKTKWKFAQ